MSMIYITGDTHCDFRRFTRRQLQRLPFKLTVQDSVIICGDFGLLWDRDGTFGYYLKWLSGLPFQILWVQGNHENYDMIEEYPIEEWNGGKVRHIVRDKIILLERGQVFNNIDGKSLFTFGGASSHDIQGGVLDKNDLDYDERRKKAVKSNLPYRVKHFSWWEQELPTEEELQEGMRNLERVDFQVDYVISHCASNRTQDAVEMHYSSGSFGERLYEQNILTDYFDMLEDKLQFKKWYFGHYHDDFYVDDKHILLYETMIPLEDGGLANDVR